MRYLLTIIIALCYIIFMPAISAQAADYSPVTLTIVAPNGTPLPGMTVVTPGRIGDNQQRDWGSSGISGTVGITDRRVGESLQLEISPRRYVDGGGWQCPNAMSPVKQITVNPSETSVTVQFDSTLDQVDHPELSTEEQTFIDMVNTARSQRGRSPVHEVPRLSQLASVEAAATDIYQDRMSEYAHLGLQCELLDTRLAEGGVVVNPNTGGFIGEVETEGSYQITAQAAYNNFKNSPPHWTALMRSDIKDIGVALVNRAMVADIGDGNYTITGPDLVHHRTMPAWTVPVAPPPATGGGGNPTGNTSSLSIDRPPTTTVDHSVEISGTAEGNTVTVTYGGKQQTVAVDEENTWNTSIKAVKTGSVTVTDSNKTKTTTLRVKMALTLAVKKKGSRYTLKGIVRPNRATPITVTVAGHRHRITSNSSGIFVFHYRSKRRQTVKVTVAATADYVSTSKTIR